MTYLQFLLTIYELGEQAVVTRWFTNLPVQKSTEMQKSETIAILKSFDQKEYPAYDNYGAFECSKVTDIPKDTEITVTIDKDICKAGKIYIMMI